ncbi:hypothetical protein XELAEV_18030247mg [Xenopus laevis]|uniref:Uncharacterized protein n=1 Tax=Xenopus laevis TaxID=8355 RepID=A0A974CT08_XENLA|nr:hypothetical protein XELAEV_18030247mg [Xenopus laevis]
MGDLYDPDGLQNFSKLQKAYKLPDAQLYTYLRIQHYLQANQWLGPHQPTKFELKCWTPTCKRKGTTIIYNLLLLKNADKPQQLLKSGKQTCQRDVGMMMHIWWDCPLAQSYWHKIRDLIHQSTGIFIIFRPALFLLDLEIPHGDKDLKRLIMQILLASRSLLAQYWRQSVLPSLQEITKEVEHIQLYERLFYFHQLKA